MTQLNSVMITIVCLTKCFMIRGQDEIESRIIFGNIALISDFPHSAYLYIMCQQANIMACGSSIVNQWIILTAAHCTFACDGLPLLKNDETFITAYVGHEDNTRGKAYQIQQLLNHPDYDDQRLTNDIAIVFTSKPIELNSNVQRVALYAKPPYDEEATVVGWGLTNETEGHYKFSPFMKFAKQQVISRNSCRKYIEGVLESTICTVPTQDLGYAAAGDSGSGLIVRGHILIGLVSFKVPNVSNRLAVFTDVGYFYQWIKEESQTICGSES